MPNTNLFIFLGTVIAVLLAVVRASRLSNSYSEPLSLLVRQGERMSRLAFEPTDPVASHIEEICALADTLEGMRKALHTFGSNREDLRLARSIQAASIPTQPPQIAGFDTAAWTDTEAEIGGEIWDALPTERGAVIMTLDVAGRDIDAAIKAAGLRTVFRACVRAKLSLAATAQSLHNTIRNDLNLSAPVKAWLASIESGQIESLAFGHDAPVLSQAKCEIRTLDSAAVALGHSERLQAAKPEIVADLAPGDTIVIASDGVIGALDGERSTFGTEGIAAVLRASTGEPAERVISRIRTALDCHTANRPKCEAQTILVFRRTD